jgi:predicted DNA-binding transcriptional regulator AlpA
MQATSVDVNPSSEVLSPAAVHIMLGLSLSTMLRLRRQGQFPAPLKLSPGRVGFLRVDIESWLRSREAAAGHSKSMRSIHGTG